MVSSVPKKELRRVALHEVGESHHAVEDAGARRSRLSPELRQQGAEVGRDPLLGDQAVAHAVGSRLSYCTVCPVAGMPRNSPL